MVQYVPCPFRPSLAGLNCNCCYPDRGTHDRTYLYLKVVLDQIWYALSNLRHKCGNKLLEPIPSSFRLVLSDSTIFAPERVSSIQGIVCSRYVNVCSATKE